MRVRFQEKHTFEQLNDWFSYEPETGIFRWKRSGRGGKAVAGEISGRLSLKYWCLKIEQTEYRGHRVAWLLMTGAWPVDQIDHRDEVKSNNRWSNLRAATNKQNHENIRTYAHNTSGLRGVRYEEKRGHWYAYITHHQRMRNLGHHPTLLDAAAARFRAERSLFTHSPACASS
jgi:hypothetical protein